MNRICSPIRVALSGLGLLALLGLSSCVTLFTDQDTLRGYPIQALKTASDKQSLNRSGRATQMGLPIPGLANQGTGNAAFPDFYLFVEQSQSRPLFGVVAKSLSGAAAVNGIKLQSLDAAFLDRVNQALLYQSAGGKTMQAVLIGRFPTEILRAFLLGQPGWQQRMLTMGDGMQRYAFENAESRLRLGLVSDMFLCLQQDLSADPKAGRDLFDNHFQRVYSLENTEFTPVVNVLAEKEAAVQAALAAQAVNADSGSAVLDPNGVPAELLNSAALGFDKVLVTEKPRDAIFALGSVAAPASLPVKGIRFRVEALKESDPLAPNEGPLVDFQFSLLPRDPAGLKQLKAGLRFMLMGIANSAGLDAAFLNPIQFTESNGLLVITGIRLSETGAAKLLGELVGLGSQAAAGTNPLAALPVGADAGEAAPEAAQP